MKFHRLLLIPAIIIGLAACAMPGSNIDPNGEYQMSKSQRDELPSGVRTYRITPGLLHDIRPETPKLGDTSQLAHDLETYEYRIGKGDILHITVWDHPELTNPSGTYRNAAETGNWVHPDGTIFYPYIGRVAVDGLRLSEVRELLTKQLSRYIENPQLDVTVAEFRSKRVYITGQVAESGTVPISNVPLTLLDAINQRGGLSEEADWREVRVTRGDQEFTVSLKDVYQHGDVSQDMLLQHRDVIHVPHTDALKVFVLGEVAEAQPVPIGRDRLSLAEAVASAGGLNEGTADATGVFVLRAVDEADVVAEVYQLDARDATAMVLAERFTLQPRDVVYVTAAPMARWNRVINQLLPSSSVLRNVTGTLDDVGAL